MMFVNCLLFWILLSFITRVYGFGRKWGNPSRRRIPELGEALCKSQWEETGKTLRRSMHLNRTIKVRFTLDMYQMKILYFAEVTRSFFFSIFFIDRYFKFKLINFSVLSISWTVCLIKKTNFSIHEYKLIFIKTLM